MKRKLISLSEIKRKEAALYAQYLMNGEAVAWLYILTGDYFEFTYPGREYPSAVRPAVDQYFRVHNTTPLIRALMKFTIDGNHCWTYPGELADENGELFKVTLDEIRFDEHGEASYEVDPEGNPESVRFSLAQFSLEMANQLDQPEIHPQQPALEASSLWDGVRKGNCNIAIGTYLQLCFAANQTPSAQMCWESAKKYASDYNQNWMIFPKIRYPNEDTKKVNREKFDQRFKKMLERFTGSD